MALRATWNEKLIDNIILYLIFQPNVTADEYAFCFEGLYEYALDKQLNDYFILLGDLLDANIYGTSSVHAFEKRIGFYIKSGCINRLIGILMLMHQKMADKALKKKIELQILEMMGKKTSYTISDFKLMITYSCMGVSQPISTAFKHFQFTDVVSSDNLLARELLRTYEDLGNEAKVIPFDKEYQSL